MGAGPTPRTTAPRSQHDPRRKTQHVGLGFRFLASTARCNLFDLSFGFLQLGRAMANKILAGPGQTLAKILYTDVWVISLAGGPGETLAKILWCKFLWVIFGVLE